MVEIPVLTFSKLKLHAPHGSLSVEVEGGVSALCMFREYLLRLVVNTQAFLACAYHKTREGFSDVVKAAINRSDAFLSEVCNLPRMSHQTGLFASRKAVQGIACDVHPRDLDIRGKSTEQGFQHSSGISLQFREGACVAILRVTIELCSVRHLLTLQVFSLRLSFHVDRYRLYSVFLATKSTDTEKYLFPAQGDREASIGFMEDHATKFFSFKVFLGLLRFFA